jgi:sortase A
MNRLAAILAAIGLLALAYCAFVYFQASRFQATEKTRFDEDTHPQSDPRAESAPTAPAVSPKRSYPSRGEAVAVLTIPRIGLSAVVLEGAGAHELKLGPGHIPSTPLPGGGGNVGVAGHRDTFFRELRLIRVSDMVFVKGRDQELRYRVVSTKVVGPRDIQVLEPTGHETITLVTCYPFDYLGSAPKRFIVRADCDDCSRRADDLKNR